MCDQGNYRVGWRRAQICDLPHSGLTNDAAGNVTADGVHTYQWDAEGRASSIDGAAQIYNALGERVYSVYPGAPISLVFDPAGQLMGAIWSWAWNYFLYFQGRMLAEYEADGAHFGHANGLGSVSQDTDWTGTTAQPILFYPWGQVWQNPTGQLGNALHQEFASLPGYDPSLDQYVTQFRRYSPTAAIWLSPDPLAGDISNPQSLNRYAYVLNNPTSLTDPLGLDNCKVTGTCGRNGGAGYNDAYAYNPPCSGLSGFFGICAPNYSQEAAAAEAQYAVNICPNCAGIGYTAGGLTYTWVPSAFSQNGGVISITTGYWSVGSVNDLGFFGQLAAYANDAVSAARNWVASALATPPGVSIGIVLPPGESWGNSATLERHFVEHGADFGSTSAYEYAQQASDFLVQSQADSLPTKIDSEGVIRVYDPSTNTFGSYNPNGTTRTFFQPTSPSYFARQPGALVPRH